jgi:hypothetical protein
LDSQNLDGVGVGGGTGAGFGMGFSDFQQAQEQLLQDPNLVREMNEHASSAKFDEQS